MNKEWNNNVSIFYKNGTYECEDGFYGITESGTDLLTVFEKVVNDFLSRKEKEDRKKKKLKKNQQQEPDGFAGW